jgi:hypothetical protein
MSKLRSCIDLHAGVVKQIVGASLTDDSVTTNLTSIASFDYLALLGRKFLCNPFSIFYLRVLFLSELMEYRNFRRTAFPNKVLILCLGVSFPDKLYAVFTTRVYVHFRRGSSATPRTRHRNSSTFPSSPES